MCQLCIAHAAHTDISMAGEADKPIQSFLVRQCEWSSNHQTWMSPGKRTDFLCEPWSGLICVFPSCYSCRRGGHKCSAL